MDWCATTVVTVSQLSHLGAGFQICVAGSTERGACAVTSSVLLVGEVIVDGKQRQFQTAGHADLVEDVGEVMFHRVFTEQIGRAHV